MGTDSFSLSVISDKASINTGLCLLRQEQILSSLFYRLEWMSASSMNHSRWDLAVT